MSKSLRLLAVLLALLVLAGYGSRAIAQTRYEFFLDTSLGGDLNSGTGFFIVDTSSIPLHGEASIVATGFEGNIPAGNGLTGYPTHFGYSRGTEVTYVWDPIEGHFLVDSSQTPTSAVITFRNHLPVGIDYYEQHSKTYLGFDHDYTESYSVLLSRAGWDLAGSGLDAIGFIRFAPPVPEPTTLMLMLSGLVLLASATRQRPR